MNMKSLAPAILCLSALALTISGRLIAADVIVGANVAAAKQTPLDQIDHTVWDELLKKYADANGMVNYKAWKANSSDAQALDQYLENLSHSNGQGTKEQKLSFWINAYNAVTVKGILREYPTSSIRNHTAKLIGYNIWKNLKLIVGGKPVSLDEMEHQVLRKMGEPRIHFPCLGPILVSSTDAESLVLVLNAGFCAVCELTIMAGSFGPELDLLFAFLANLPR